jgi:RNA polymerase sigma factor (TIGR02999 family)
MMLKLQPYQYSPDIPTKPQSRPVDDLFSAAYDELRRLAKSVRRDNPSATLNPTALVNEAWLKLVNSSDFEPNSAAHIKGIAARAMRQVLVDAARRRNASKRGGEPLVTFDESLEGSSSGGRDVLALNDVLEELESIEPRQAKVVEYRYFGGYSVAETAELLGVCELTVNRDWKVARAWLKGRLQQQNKL